MYKIGWLNLNSRQMGIYIGSTVHEVAHVVGAKSKITIPWFAFGFLIVIGFNSFNLLSQVVFDSINSADDFALTMAMTPLGVVTNFKKFKQSGFKPFILASILFIWQIVGGYFISSFIQF